MNNKSLVGIFYNKENAEIVLINPLIPDLGGLLKLGDTPRPPTGSILHLFFSDLEGVGMATEQPELRP